MIDFFLSITSFETLCLAWWLFMVLIIIGFAITGGFDLGITTLLPFIAHTDDERRVVINSIGPTWEGNQTWLVLAGGALFAAWPRVYAASFSTLFIAMYIALFALIVRPGGFKYRGLIKSKTWRNVWDWCLFTGGIVPALIFGVAFGNLFLGLPFQFDDNLRLSASGSFFALLNPFGLLVGLAVLFMFLFHGALFLQIKTDDVIYNRSKQIVKVLGPIVFILFAIVAYCIVFVIPGYHITNSEQALAQSNPLLKTVAVVEGGWTTNFKTYSWMLIAPLTGTVSFVLAWFLSALNRPGAAFFMSTLFIAGICFTGGFSLFPFIMPSTSDLNSSLTIWDATSSHLTLIWLTVVTAIFLPIIIAYTSWVFSKLRGTVSLEYVKENTKTLY